MARPKSKTKGDLDGIVGGACRQLGIASKPFRAKMGGESIKGNADEFYVPLQNLAGKINTKKAIEQGMIKRCFCIINEKRNGSDDPILKITEWAAKQDQGKSSYRTIWEAPLNAHGARNQMMVRFISAYRELILGEGALG